MKKLFVYACSHGKFGTMVTNKWRDEHSWPSIVATEFNLELHNKSKPGCHNYAIFYNCLSDYQMNLFDKDSIVIIQWSHIERAWQRSGGTIMPHVPSKQSKIYYRDLFNEHQEINKVLGYTLILKELVDNLFFDFADGRKFLEDNSKSTVSIIKRTNGYLNCLENIITDVPDNMKFPCSHLNLHGHKNLADIYIKRLQEKI